MHRYLAALGPPLLYSVMALAMTWPLPLNLTTHIPGTGGDGPNFLWRLWWVPHALFERGISPWHTDLLFHPQGASLLFDTLSPLYGILSYPLQALAGVVFAYNLLLIASLALAAWGTYMLALHLTGERRAALLAGTVFGFSPYLLVHLWGHLNLVAAWPLPLFALCLIRALEAGSPRWALAAGTLLGATSLLDYQYGVFALLWAILAALHTRRFNLGTWLPVAAAALVVFSPLLVPAVEAALRGENPIAGNPGDSVYFSADLLAFFLPSTVRWGQSLDPMFETREFQGVGGIEGTAYLGLVPLALAAVAVLSLIRPGRPLPEPYPEALEGVEGRGGAAFGPAFWLMTAGLFALLALGPRLHIAGADTSLPLPYTLLQLVPYLGATRVPARFVVMVGLGVAVLAAYGFTRLAVRGPTVLCAAAIVAIAAEYSVIPLPLRSVEVPAFYRTLAQESGSFGIVPLPMLLEAGPRGGSLGRGDQVLQYYQTIHQRPMTFGHVARGPRELLDFYQRRPVLRWLGNPEIGPPMPEDMDGTNLRKLVEELDLRYAVIHRAHYDPVSLMMLREYFGSVLGQQNTWEDSEIVAFRLRGDPVETGPAAVQDFHRRFFEPRVQLLSPQDGAAGGYALPILRWQPTGDPSPLFEVQISRDPWFGRTFLYHETVDGRVTDPPFSYRMPAQYPPVSGATYYWRVRRVEGDTSSPWTAPWRFVAN